MAASSSSRPLQQALTQIIQRASVSTATYVDPAVERLTASQEGLEAELQRLDEEMASVTSVLETVTLDPETSARMQETQECLKRTKKKLITIRGRLGRLRAYEESDRLRLAERSMDAFREGVVGGSVGDGEDGVEGKDVVVDAGDDRAQTNGAGDVQEAHSVSPAPSREDEDHTPTSHGLT